MLAEMFLHKGFSILSVDGNAASLDFLIMIKGGWKRTVIRQEICCCAGWLTARWLPNIESGRSEDIRGKLKGFN